ncbi:hypothetical protein [Microbacterium oxydans]|uniref:hypothetical protein n=1 Tax=Microbacterium oxydans TaxID=82380 RepID=UPI00226B39CE|nr:hypothetical protein [Microbacterium oxydans]WAA65621.1 hypothetical protein MME74_15515 [Microbacterium oxydans]
MNLSFFLGLLVAFGGALLLASGSELQSRAVYESEGRWCTFTRSPRWLLGLLLLGVAVSTNFIALALTPVSAVQSMSVVALAASASFGALAGRVTMTRAGVLSVLLCMIGILGFVAILATHPASGAPALDHHAQLVVTTVILAGLTALGGSAVLLGRRSSVTGARVFGLIMGAMVFGSITTVFKTIVTLVLEDGLVVTLTQPATLLGLGTVALGGLVANLLLQRSHRFFPVPVVVAALTIVDPLAAAVVGIVVLGEVSLTLPAIAGLIACGAIACVGVAGVSRLRRKTIRPAPASVPESPVSHS